MSLTITSYASATQERLTGGGYDPDLTLAKVRSTIFDFEVDDQPLYADDGQTKVAITTHKALVNSKTGNVLSVVGIDRPTHQYGEWLTRNVETMLDASDLVVKSAGTLGNGARGFVQVGTPEDVTGPGGIAFRPIIGAYTGVDMSSIYKANTIVVICENTYQAAKSEGGAQYRVKHSKNATFNVLSAREALGIVFDTRDAFSAELERLLSIKVTPRKFRSIVDRVALIPTLAEGQSTRGLTMAANKQAALYELWSKDERVAPWKGTAFGAMQALSTYRQWIQTVKNSTREERNMLNVMNGTSDKADAADLALILETVGA